MGQGMDCMGQGMVRHGQGMGQGTGQVWAKVWVGMGQGLKKIKLISMGQHGVDCKKHMDDFEQVIDEYHGKNKWL